MRVGDKVKFKNPNDPDVQGLISPSITLTIKDIHLGRARLSVYSWNGTTETVVSLNKLRKSKDQ